MQNHYRLTYLTLLDGYHMWMHTPCARQSWWITLCSFPSSLIKCGLSMLNNRRLSSALAWDWLGWLMDLLSESMSEMDWPRLIVPFTNWQHRWPRGQNAFRIWCSHMLHVLIFSCSWGWQNTLKYWVALNSLIGWMLRLKYFFLLNASIFEVSLKPYCISDWCH